MAWASAASAPESASRKNTQEPSRKRLMSPASAMSFRCRLMRGWLWPRIWVRSLTFSSPPANSARMRKRVASPAARKAASAWTRVRPGLAVLVLGVARHKDMFIRVLQDLQARTRLGAPIFRWNGRVAPQACTKLCARYNCVRPREATTSSINRKFFFDQVNLRLFDGKLSAKTRRSLNQILDYWEKNHAKDDDRWLAYALGTAHHETDRTSAPSANMGEAGERNIIPITGAASCSSLGSATTRK